jgi:hypothetical protein
MSFLRGMFLLCFLVQAFKMKGLTQKSGANAPPVESLVK